MTSTTCPICDRLTLPLLWVEYGPKGSLPTRVYTRSCTSCNFLFNSPRDQKVYDEFYPTSTIDTMGPTETLVPYILAWMTQNTRAKRVLDFGCGDGSLVKELARSSPGVEFYGYDPGPRVKEGVEGNVHLSRTGIGEGDFDLIIMSHVVEHLMDFSVLATLYSVLSKRGVVYVEVPNALLYQRYPQLEFMYYFDRLHVNHFTLESLSVLMEKYGFGLTTSFERTFPYYYSPYPALGAFFDKWGGRRPLSHNFSDTAAEYVRQEKIRASTTREFISSLFCKMVWGCGDNFYRASQNGGPLEGIEWDVVMDSCLKAIKVNGKRYMVVSPEVGLEREGPVVVTVGGRGRREVGVRIVGKGGYRTVVNV
jgi:SAM-dependent methyltransferase